MMVTVAVLGGTGKEGSGLAMRWAQSGYRVIVGSRDAERAKSKATEFNEILGESLIEGAHNQEAAARADIVVLTVPYDAHQATLESVRNEVQGKILVDVTVPMQPPDIRRVFVPAGKAAALETQAIVGDGVKVVSAFQNVSAAHLKKLEHEVACDVLVTGDDDQAKTEVIHLVEAAGMRGIDAGPLVNAVAAEALTPVLMYINKKYSVKGAGIHITGIAAE
ncbi:MAG: NADPH-dependent F420 reductase [Chloroflexi bacterium]|nr:NADPH-dependent F420 reductase [Chloroflexota bacterium]NOG62237.1 NADPH-dependent F420 reductase [Chloroflexota bacterium]